MSGKCTDNLRIGIVGCGATYGGETQHCVADVPWSTHTDGKAHITGRLSTIEMCWVAPTKGARAVLVDPATIGSLRLDDKGIYRQNIDGDHWATADAAPTMVDAITDAFSGALFGFNECPPVPGEPS